MQELIKGQAYHINGHARTYLGVTHVDGGREEQHRFKGEGPNSYVSKTSSELSRMMRQAQSLEEFHAYAVLLVQSLKKA